jgi:hypothetical protein
MQLVFSKIKEMINEWEKSSPEKKEGFIKNYSNRPDVLNTQIERLDKIINTLKNATDVDMDIFRENEGTLNKYEDILIKEIYSQDDRSKSMLQRRFDEIDELMIDKLNSAGSSSQSAAQQPTTPSDQEAPPPAPPLDAAGIEELNNIFGRLGFQ